MHPRSVAALTVLLVALAPAGARAQHESELDLGQTLLHTELAFTTPFGPAADDDLAPGGSALVGLWHSLHPDIVVGLQGRASLFAHEDGDGQLALAADDALYAVTGALRLRIMGTHLDPARGTGPFVEVGGGVAFSDALDPWPVLEVGVGWGIEAGDVDVVPTLRYQHVFDVGSGESRLIGGHALVGIGFTFADPRDHDAS
ncbi:MAG TPA: hypothetical protein RMH99_18765 [Sandaracinaceae bacterium LLY-WYZ-13_1]|nr:hypothetical protein [Sandaracinaceae bacterium LLY-WYZ-13_1]